MLSVVDIIVVAD